MKTIHLQLDDAVLSGLIAEQIGRFSSYRIGDERPDLVIARVKTDRLVPHILMGGKMEEGCEVLALPLRLGELTDRIGYLLSGRTRLAQSETIEFAGFTLDAADGTMSRRNDSRQIRLTDKEKLLILSLFAEETKSLDRAALLQKVWSYAETAETHTLETHLYRLRQKFEDGFGITDLIVTKDGIYTLKI